MGYHLRSDINFRDLATTHCQHRVESFHFGRNWLWVLIDGFSDFSNIIFEHVILADIIIIVEVLTPALIAKYNRWPMDYLYKQIIKTLIFFFRLDDNLYSWMIFKGLTLNKFFTAYKPMIRFPNRQAGSQGAPSFQFSGKKIKMTNREALNQAMKEEI